MQIGRDAFLHIGERVIGDQQKAGSKGGGTNLGSLIRNVMGDNFFEEEKYLKLPVPSVLFQLDRMVREEKERKRHERKTN